MAALIQEETTVRLDWIGQRVGMGERSLLLSYDPSDRGNDRMAQGVDPSDRKDP